MYHDSSSWSRSLWNPPIRTPEASMTQFRPWFAVGLLSVSLALAACQAAQDQPSSEDTSNAAVRGGGAKPKPKPK